MSARQLIVVMSVLLLGCLVFLVCRMVAKYEVCKMYYPEISMSSCYVSDYGLPARGKR